MITYGEFYHDYPMYSIFYLYIHWKKKKKTTNITGNYKQLVSLIARDYLYYPLLTGGYKTTNISGPASP